MRRSFSLTISVLALSLLAACLSLTEILPATSTGVATEPPEPTEESLSSLSPAVFTGRNSVFIGAGTGDYSIVDINTGLVISKTLTGECRITSRGESAICQSGSKMYFYDLSTSDRSELPFTTPFSWGFSPDQELFYYVVENNDSSYDFFDFDLVHGATKLITIDPQEWLVFPRISANGDYLIGVAITESDTVLMRIDIQTGLHSQINSLNISHITDIGLSNNNTLIGIGNTETLSGDVRRCTTTIFSIFNIATEKQTQLSHSPDGECYDYFGTYSRNIWSPDDTRVVLIAGQNICVIDIEDSEQSCYKIAQSEESVVAAAWSPDSQNLAYLARTSLPRKYNLHVMSADGQTNSVLLGNIQLNSFIVDLFWSKP